MQHLECTSSSLFAFAKCQVQLQVCAWHNSTPMAAGASAARLNMRLPTLTRQQTSRAAGFCSPGEQFMDAATKILRQTEIPVRLVLRSFELIEVVPA